MSVATDWVEMEAAISSLLPRGGVSAARQELLARLDEYAFAATSAARELGPTTPSAGECEHALEWLLRPVFICGHHRSGTTLLQNLLDGHPELMSLPSEATYFDSFGYVARRGHTERDLERFAAEWISRLVDPNFAPHFRLGRSDSQRNPSVEFARLLFGWHAALQGSAPRELVQLLALAAAFKAATAPESTPRHWVEKTPLNERHVARLEFFRAARFIHVVRDPRATFASLAALYRGGGRRFDAAAGARAIGRSLRLAYANARRRPDRYLVVRYEDLIGAPRAEMERVRGFLDVAFDATLLVPTAGGQPVRANSSFADAAVGVVGGPRVHGELETRQAALIGAYAARAASAFGYELAAPGPVARGAILLKAWPRHALQDARGFISRWLAARPRLRRQIRGSGE